MTVRATSWYLDAQGAWRVAGLIHNGWDRPVSKIVTEVEALDAAGRLIDHGEDISAYPLNLQPGAQAPFSAWIKRDFAGAARFVVNVDLCVPAEDDERASIQVLGGRLAFDAAGRAHVTAEAFNPNPRPVLVNGLMAAIFDGAGVPLAAGNAAVSARYLGPGERGPVRVTLDMPPAAAGRAAGYRLYMDPVVAEPRPATGEHDLRVAGRYVDAAGKFHVLAELTNPGPQGLALRLEATLYQGAPGTTVADAAYVDAAPPLAPGETRKFDLAEWGPANSTPGLAQALLDRGATLALRLDPFQTWTVAATPGP